MKYTKLISLTFLFATLSTFGSLSWSLPSYKFDPVNGEISFLAKGYPSFIKISGKGEGASGELKTIDNKLNGTLTFNLTSLKTGIGMRDTHMKDKYLQVKKFPTATLTLTDRPLPKDEKGKFEFQGNLEIHGKKKQVKITGTLSALDKKTLKVEGEIPILLADFGIPVPSYNGITVAKDVKIRFSTKVQKLQSL